MKIDRKKDKNKQLFVIRLDPKVPKCLPNNPARHELINEKKINNKYIMETTGFEPIKYTCKIYILPIKLYSQI